MAKECCSKSSCSKEEETKDVGRKFDGDKERFDLVPPDSLLELTKVITYGQKKYGERNWEKGMKFGRLFAALMRHLWKWWGGEKYDEESGLSHLSHAAANVFFLLHYEINYNNYTSWDNRHKIQKKEGDK